MQSLKEKNDYPKKLNEIVSKQSKKKLQIANIVFQGK